jgi:hypothetical protein
VLLIAAFSSCHACLAQNRILKPGDIPVSLTLHVHEGVRLPLPDPCRYSPICEPQFSVFVLDDITGQIAHVRFAGHSFIDRPEKLTVGATLASWEGGLAFTLTNLTATSASLTIFYNQERKPAWLFASSNYGAVPHTIRFQSWTLNAGYHVDFGDGTKTIMPQCPIRVGHCISSVTVLHVYLAPGRLTAALFDPTGKSVDHWPITIVAAMPGKK